MDTKKPQTATQHLYNIGNNVDNHSNTQSRNATSNDLNYKTQGVHLPTRDPANSGLRVGILKNLTSKTKNNFKYSPRFLRRTLREKRPEQSSSCDSEAIALLPLLMVCT